MAYKKLHVLFAAHHRICKCLIILMCILVNSTYFHAKSINSQRLMHRDLQRPTDIWDGMVDIDARRPLVFTAADATTWLVPEISGEQAAELARSMALGPDKFAWFPVGRAVGNVRNQGAQLAQRQQNL